MGSFLQLDSLLHSLDSNAAVAHFSQSAASAVISAIWQGLALALCLSLCLRLAPRTSAAHRFAIWACCFGAIVALPFLPLLLRLNETHAVPSLTVSSSLRPWLTLDARWSIAITAIWLCASLVRAVDLAVHTSRLRKLWKSASVVRPDTALTVPLALPHRKPVQLCTTDSLERPSVIGFFAPRILFPRWLFDRLSTAELEQIVMHETEHLRRGDDWTNLLQKLCLVVFPLSPALLWIERRLCLEREMACDEGVVRRTHAPRDYAACLTSLAERSLEHRTAQALSLGAWQRRPELVQRVHSILRRTPLLQPTAARGLVAILGCSLLIGSAELARCPQFVAFESPSASRELQSASNATDASLLGDRVYQPQLQNDRARTGSLQPHMTELKATIPASQPIAIRRPGKKLRTQAAPADNPSTPEQILVSAKTPESPAQPLPAVSAPAQQSWIVLTTWEEVETAPATQSVSDSEVAAQTANGQSPNGQCAKAAQSPSSQVTVTRLIFRVMPANAASPQPVLMPWRAGWLVFQL